MSVILTRRALLAGLAASAAVPAFGEAPAGSARYLVELLVFRQPGAPPKPTPAGPLPTVSTIAGRVEPLPESSWQLGAARDTLARRGGYAILGHTAWSATVPPNGRTTARLEDVLRDGTPLAGAVAVQRSQYLFLAVDIDYVAGPEATYGLRERRRIKFGERHYFDHAAFGVIAQVTPRSATAAD